MPKQKKDWVNIKPEELILRKCAFWYQVEANEIYSTNKYKITIEIPKQNRITMDFFDNQFLALD